jgi:hypothetical protein
VEYSANYQIGDQAAQQLSPEAATGIMAFAGVMILIVLLVVVAFWIYSAICMMKIAKRTNTANGWFAWIPILNIILMLQIAKKPLWWIILCLIPIVNLVIMVIVWMAIAKALGKPEWLGIVFVLAPLASIIPVIGAIVGIVGSVVALGYLAFSDNKAPIVKPAKA